MTTAIVVGSGPNGLAAAAVLARAGLQVTVLEAHEEIGGGTRSGELTVPGVVHDLCSAVHPLAQLSPVFNQLTLAAHGLEWAWPEVDLAHPLDDGSAGVLQTSLAATVDGLGPDGPAWHDLFGRVAADLPGLAPELLQPLVHLPRQPRRLARFGLAAAQPATLLARRFETARARGLWAGVAAHMMHDLSAPLSSSIGLLLTAASHAVGWPVAVGGSQAIAAALSGVVKAAGGRIETGVEVTDIEQVTHADVVMLDVAPGPFLAMAGTRLPSGVARSLARWRRGPAAYKLDLAVQDGIPWTNPACRRAGTVHLGGSLEEVAAAERAVVAGRMPQRPFVLVAQQYLADPSRSRGDLHPVWAYAHVPHGHPGDATDAVLDQFERFAPGTRGRIVATEVTTPAGLAATNANYSGGDIAAGATTPWQLVWRPRPTLRPYASGIPSVWLCSAATPPGPGVHGMGGANAAAAALSDLDH